MKCKACDGQGVSRCGHVCRECNGIGEAGFFAARGKIFTGRGLPTSAFPRRFGAECADSTYPIATRENLMHPPEDLMEARDG